MLLEYHYAENMTAMTITSNYITFPFPPEPYFKVIIEERDTKNRK